MGKASSTKKVARVARTGGGRTARGRGSLLWPGVLTITVVLGTFLIFYSREQNQTSVDRLPPQRGDHWHAAYGVYLCDKFVDPVADQNDPLGIHTHADGVIHVHPKAAASSGENATLGVFMDAVKAKVTSSEIKIPGEKTMKNGDKCGNKEGRVEARTWNKGAPADDEGKLVAGNPADMRLLDNQLVTIAFVPEGTKVPQPPSAPTLDNLSDVTTTTPALPDVPTTTPGATTTAPPATTSTSTAAPGP